jgi:glyoxylase-like metal-dependent hydrolase (beta-lactamase superfamily II)
MEIKTIQTGSTLVSSAVPDRSTHKSPFAYTGLFQRRNKRISVPVKCFYVCVVDHHVLIDAGWSKEVVEHPIRHLGFGLWFASEPVMHKEEAAVTQLHEKPVDAILMTHLDSDHVSGLQDFSGIPIYASEEEIRAAGKNRLRYGKLTKGKDIQAFEFTEDKLAPFGKSLDFYEDGTIVAYLTPTHSAGSVVYKISDGDRFALVVGDNGYKEDAWKNCVLPGPLYNAENMRRCLRWINYENRKQNCDGVYCAHDPVKR